MPKLTVTPKEPCLRLELADCYAVAEMTIGDEEDFVRWQLLLRASLSGGAPGRGFSARLSPINPSAFGYFRPRDEHRAPARRDTGRGHTPGLDPGLPQRDSYRRGHHRRRGLWRRVRSHQTRYRPPVACWPRQVVQPALADSDRLRPAGGGGRDRQRPVQHAGGPGVHPPLSRGRHPRESPGGPRLVGMDPLFQPVHDDVHHQDRNSDSL